MEAKRQFDVLNRRLVEERIYRRPRLYDRRHRDLAMVRRRRARLAAMKTRTIFLATDEYEHLMRWARQIDERPAVKRGRIVNKMTGDPSEQLHERHDASDFELRTQDKVPLTPEEEDLAAVRDDAI